MVYSLQLLLEYVLHGGNILEGDGAFLEIAFCHLRIDNLVYQVADALFESAIIRIACSLVNGLGPG